MRKILAGLTLWIFLATVHAATDLTPLMPPPMDQHWPQVPSCGSCTFAYALKTYYEGIDRGWSVLTPNHQFAPNYLHNQVGYLEGLGINEGERNCWIMANRGVCTLADEPYTTDQVTWPTVAQCQAGLNFRNDLIGGLPFGSIVGYDAATRKPNLTAIRAALDQGKVLGMYFTYFNGFETLNSSTNYVYYSVYQSGVQVYHWVAIVGYDDTKTDGAGHVGALKIQNSFGPNWADHGYGWIAYDALNYASMPVGNTQGKFYFLKNLPASYAATITARISVSHPLNAGNRITVGVGDINAPAWQHTYYDFQPDYFTDVADPVHTNLSTVVDVTSAAAFWPPTAQRAWWVKVEDPFADSLKGTITEFSVTQGATTLSTRTPLPVSIPDPGSAYAYIYGNRPPVFSSPLTITPNPSKVGQSVSFTTAATDPDGDALTYTWNFGDAATQSGATASHAYAAPGVYTVTVTAADSGGLSVTASSSITVSAVAPPPLTVTTVSPLPNGKVGLRYTLQFTATGGTAPYRWSAIDPFGLGALPPPGMIFSMGGILTGTPRTAGTYTFMVGCQDSAGKSTTAMVTITINPAMVLTVASLKAGVNFIVAGHDTVTLTGTIPSVLTKTTGQSVSLDLGGVSQTFVLDSKGRAATPSGTIALKAQQGHAAFTCKLQAGSFGGTWGLSATAKTQKSTLTFPVYVNFSGEAYAADVTVSCLSKSTSGSLKK